MKLTGDRCKCTICGEFFNSTRAFDKHRVGSYEPLRRRCLSESEMIAKKMSKNQALFWASRVFADAKTRAFGTPRYLDTEKANER